LQFGFGNARTSVARLREHFGRTQPFVARCNSISGTPEASLQGATAFLACQKHGVRRKNDKIRVEEHE